jgi:hypothetical protein
MGTHDFEKIFGIPGPGSRPTPSFNAVQNGTHNAKRTLFHRAEKRIRTDNKNSFSRSTFALRHAKVQ